MAAAVKLRTDYSASDLPGDVVPTRNLRNHGSGFVGFGEDLFLLRRRPSAPTLRPDHFLTHRHPQTALTLPLGMSSF